MINTDREERDFMVPVMYFLIVYSLAVHLIVGLCGYYVRPANLLDPESYRGFLQKPNWSLYPFYFTISLFALRLTWTPFLSVWKKLVATKVISIKSNSPEDEVSRALVQYVGSWRWLCIAFAIAVSLLFNYFAFKADIWNMYTAKSVKEQMKIACGKPDLFSKWLFFGDKKDQDICIRSICEPYVAKNQTTHTVSEESVVITYHTGPKSEIGCEGGATPGKTPDAQIWIAGLVYAQQFIMVILASLFLLQLLLHSIIFYCFEKTKVAKAYELRIELNAESKANEFGLEHWNQALNNAYWFLSLGLLIPIVSRLSQPNPGVLDLGQNLLRIFVAILVLLPMIATIISRQVKLPSVWANLDEQENKDEAWKAYHEQRLWPLDKNWSSKFGIVVALALASFVLGAEILKVTGL